MEEKKICLSLFLQNTENLWRGELGCVGLYQNGVVTFLALVLGFH